MPKYIFNVNKYVECYCSEAVLPRLWLSSGYCVSYFSLCVYLFWIYIVDATVVWGMYRKVNVACKSSTTLLYVHRWRLSSASIRSASRRQLVVPRHHLDTFGRRAFAVAGQMSCNSLPNRLRESACDDNISDDCLKHSLKTFLFSGYWRTERSRGVHDSALYKCTFTYLLTSNCDSTKVHFH